MVRIVIGVLVVFVMGCGSAKIPPPYSEQDLRQRCERRGDVWHGDDLMGGFCETPSMM